MALFDENQRLSRILADTEDKLKEANFQRQQYQKKMLFLEELNRDLQDATEQHKKMESQIRRISEMEAILSRTYRRRRTARRSLATHQADHLMTIDRLIISILCGSANRAFIFFTFYFLLSANFALWVLSPIYGKNTN